MMLQTKMMMDREGESDQGKSPSERIWKGPAFFKLINIYDDDALDKKPDKLLTLKFEYMLKLNVVCVGIESSDERLNNILCNLFPNDDGLDLPLQSANLAASDIPIFDERKSLRPYKWAQHLAGIDFLPEMSPFLAGHEIPSIELPPTENSIKSEGSTGSRVSHPVHY